MQTGERFATEFAQNSRRVYTYILSLLPSPSDADEIFQDTSAVLWQKFSEFEPGTNFGAWACRVAYFRVMSHLKRVRTDRLVFDERFVEAVDAQVRPLHADEDLERARHRAMLACLERLDVPQRDLLRARYTDGATAMSVARTLGTTPNAVRKTLARLHRTLLRCIESRLRQEPQS